MNAISLGAVTGVITLTIFSIGLAIERVAPAATVEFHGIRLNVIYGVFIGFVRPAVATMLASISFFGIGAIGTGLIMLPSEGWMVGVSVIGYLVAVDFTEYLFHLAKAHPVVPG